MHRNLKIVVCLIVVAACAAGPVFAEDWTKLGSRTLLLSGGSDEVRIKKSVEVSELVIQVKSHQVMLKTLKVTFADGSETTVEVEQRLRPGIDSEPIALGKTGVLQGVTLMVDDTGFKASDRVHTTVLGR